MPDIIKILLAEDESSLSHLIKGCLEKTKNFEVIVCNDGEKALQKYWLERPSLLILSARLPKLNGFALAQEIKIRNKEIPFLFLIDQPHKGAEDYLQKPFNMQKLLEKISNLMDGKTIYRNNTSDIAIGKYKFNYVKQTLRYDDSTDLLTNREAEVLRYLYLNKDRIISRSHILNEIWGGDDFFKGRSLDVFISRLRKKLSRDKHIQIINSWGFGFKLTVG